MVDVTRAVKNGYAMIVAAYQAIGKTLPSYEEATTDDVGHYTEIVEFFIERPDASVEDFHEAQDDGVPYASLSMETRIMYTRLRRAALEAVQGQDEGQQSDESPDRQGGAKTADGKRRSRASTAKKGPKRAKKPRSRGSK